VNKDQIITAVKSLNLPAGSYIVFGSCPLAAAGIRESSDIDLVVSHEIFDALCAAGWQRHDDKGTVQSCTQGPFDVHTGWDFGTYNPTLADLLKTANLIDAVPFASLSEVREWKSVSARPKDLVDVALIDDYLKNNSVGK
jgi:hypothetical protein